MHKHRGILALIVVVTIAALFATLAWKAWAWYLPEPRHADGPALLRWIVLRELKDSDRQTQVLIVDRLVQQLQSGLPDTSSSVSLSAGNQARLQRNVDLLKQVWFETRVERYVACQPDQRFDYMQRQLETIWMWTDLDLGPADGTEQDAGNGATEIGSSGLLADLEGWINSASGPKAENTSRAVRDGLICWLATRSLEDQPIELRCHLAKRIAVELDSGLQPSALGMPLDTPHRAMLATNAQMLLEAWLFEQADIYAELPAAERTTYLDAQLERLAGWRIDAWLTPEEPETDAAAGMNAASLLVIAQRWVEHAPLERQANVAKLVRDVQHRVVWRGLQRLIQPAGS